MESTRVERLTNYLLSLAPDYFGEGIEPATEEDLARLEAASGRPVAGYHREFLLAMGNTETGALDPFLNQRVFGIEALIGAYPDLVNYGLSLAPDISVLTAPESFVDFEFIRTKSVPTTDQQVGRLDFETGQFFPDGIGTLEDYILEFAFMFRVGQLDHVRSFVPRGQWEPDPCKKVLAHKGLLQVSHFPDRTGCYEGGPWAAVVYNDGSGHVASDDRAALLELCDTLEDLADMKIGRSQILAAPKC